MSDVPILSESFYIIKRLMALSNNIRCHVLGQNSIFEHIERENAVLTD